MAFARYKNLGAYCAIAMEIEVDRETGSVAVHRVNAAVDAGQPASPDGIRNQVDGGIIQSLSWVTREVVTFDAMKRTSFDWGSYPIIRCPGLWMFLSWSAPARRFWGRARRHRHISRIRECPRGCDRSAPSTHAADPAKSEGRHWAESLKAAGAHSEQKTNRMGTTRSANAPRLSRSMSDRGLQTIG
jgi:hypothetical protein